MDATIEQMKIKGGEQSRAYLEKLRKLLPETPPGWPEGAATGLFDGSSNIPIAKLNLSGRDTLERAFNLTGLEPTEQVLVYQESSGKMFEGKLATVARHLKELRQMESIAIFPADVSWVLAINHSGAVGYVKAKPSPDADLAQSLGPAIDRGKE